MRSADDLNPSGKRSGARACRAQPAKRVDMPAMRLVGPEFMRVGWKTGQAAPETHAVCGWCSWTVLP